MVKESGDYQVLESLGWKTMLLVALLLWYLNQWEKAVYLIDFATFQPPDDWKVSQDQLVQMLRLQKCFSEEAIAFQERMLRQSGVGPKTAWPPGIVRHIVHVHSMRCKVISFGSYMYRYDV